MMLRFSFRRFVAQALPLTRRSKGRPRRGRSEAVQTLETRALLSAAVVRNIRPSALDSNPADLAEVNGTLYFAANDGTNG
ncbi:MAG: hypothetical protein ACK5WR_14490 [Planctomycetaceae bacterium]